MAIGAGELMVVQYNHHYPHPVNPRRHWANRPDEDFLPARPLFYRMKNGLIRPLPDEKNHRYRAVPVFILLWIFGFPGLFDLLLRRSGIVKAVQRHFFTPVRFMPPHRLSPWGIFPRCDKCLFRKCLAQFVGSFVYIRAR